MGFQKGNTAGVGHGRTSKYTEETINAFCGALEQGLTIEEACKAAKIGRSIYLKWQSEKPEFAERIEEAKKKYDEWLLNDIKKDALKSLKVLINGCEYDERKVKKDNTGAIVEDCITTKRILPNAVAVIFALCNRDPENWKNRVESNVNGKIESTTTTNLSLEKLPDDVLEKAIDAIRSKGE